MEPTHLKHIGQMVKQLREFRGLSQEQLATKSDFRRATVTDIENGMTNFQINTLVSIATALECTIDIVLTPIKTKRSK